MEALKLKIQDYKKRATNPLLPYSAVAKINEVIKELENKLIETPDKFGPSDLPKDGSAISIHMPELEPNHPAVNIELKYDSKNFTFDVYSNGNVIGQIGEKNAIDNLNQGIYVLTKAPLEDASVKNMEVLKTRVKLLKKMLAKKPTATLKTRIKIVEKMLMKVAFGSEFMASKDKGTKKTYIETDNENLKDAIAQIKKAIKNKTTFKLYEEWENDNYHSENIILEAYTVGTEADINKAIGIWNEHNTKGEMSAELDKERYELGKKLWQAFYANAKKNEKVKMERGGPIGCGCNHTKAAKGKKVEPEIGVQFIDYKGEQIMFSPKNKYQEKDEYYSNDEQFSSLKEAQAYIDKGSPMSAAQINLYRHGAMKDGGKIPSETWVISYLNKKNNFQQTDKEFKGEDSYEKAVKWGKKNLPNFNSDMVRKKFEGGGPIDEVGVDLFEDYENIPKNVQKILDKHEQGFQDGSYDELGKALKKLEKIGYTFDYYLDGAAYDLRKKGQKGKAALEVEKFDSENSIIS